MLNTPPSPPQKSLLLPLVSDILYFSVLKLKFLNIYIKHFSNKCYKLIIM
jgi:hypothetical protein